MFESLHAHAVDLLKNASESARNPSVWQSIASEAPDDLVDLTALIFLVSDGESVDQDDPAKVLAHAFVMSLAQEALFSAMLQDDQEEIPESWGKSDAENDAVIGDLIKVTPAVYLKAAGLAGELCQNALKHLSASRPT
jgi:hypothetical protein